MKFAFKTVRAAQAFAIATLTGLFLLACGSDSSTPAGTSGTGVAPATFKSASAAVQARIAADAPHVVTAAVVTGMNERHWYDLRGWHGLMPEAYAADLGLNTIWDPENGNPPTGSDFAVQNLYIGNGFSCGGTPTTCTLGSVTVPEYESLKDYMGQSLSPSFVNSNGASVTVFGRLQNAMIVVCVLSNILPSSSLDSDGLPMAGSLDFSFPSDTSNVVFEPVASGGCGVSTSLAGQAVSATVTAVTSTDYTKELAFSIGNDIHVWLGLDASAGSFNVMTLEDQRPSGRYAIDRTIAHITGANTSGAATVLFEYVSIGSNDGGSDSCYSNGGWTCGFEYHRIFIDQANDLALLVTNDGNPGDPSGGTGAPTAYIQYTAAAKPSAVTSCSAGASCAGTLALSFTADGQYEPGPSASSTIYPSAGQAYDGCVNIASRALAASATLVCDVNGASILAPGGASAMIEATREVYAGDVVATLYANTTASTTLAFTGASNIYTAANTQ